MSKWNTPTASTRRCTVCGSRYHNRSYHPASEQLGSRDIQTATRNERVYLKRQPSTKTEN